MPAAVFHAWRPRPLAVALVFALAVSACGGQNMESRARAAGDDVARSIRGSDDNALAQQADSTLVREVQAKLRDLDEYLGPLDGQLDPVTLNALQSFQRSQGLPDDGMLDATTLARLRTAAPARKERHGAPRS